MGREWTYEDHGEHSYKYRSIGTLVNRYAQTRYP